MELGVRAARARARRVIHERRAGDGLDRHVLAEGALPNVFDAGHRQVSQLLQLRLGQPVRLVEGELLLVVGPVPAADEIGSVAGVALCGSRAGRSVPRNGGRRPGDRWPGGNGSAGTDREKGNHGDDNREGENPSHRFDYGRPDK